MAKSPHRPIRPLKPGRSGAGAPGSLTPVPRESTVDLIADRLRQAIFDGTLPAGAPLGEAELSEQLGVSRGPIREAAQRLVQERLLVPTRRRGLTVVTIGDEDISDIYLARAAVERAACHVVLRGDPSRVVRALTRAHQRMVRASGKRDARAAGDADIEFHRALVDGAGSPRLSAQIGTLLIETRLCSYSLDTTYRVSAALPDSHAVLIDALRDGNEQRLLDAVDHHMSDAVERLTATPDGPDTIAGANSTRRTLRPLGLPPG